MKEKNKYLEIINQIESVRTRNNKNWMDLLRLAFEHSPKEAKLIFSEIFKQDSEITRLSKKLIKLDD